MRLIVVGAIVAVGLAVGLLAGCGEDEMTETASGEAASAETSSAGSAAAGETSEQRRPRPTTELRLRDSDYGPVLFDDKGARSTFSPRRPPTPVGATASALRRGPRTTLAASSAAVEASTAASWARPSDGTGESR